MLRLTGKSICKGIAVGPVAVLKRREKQTAPALSGDPKTELERFWAAVGKTKAQLVDLCEKALKEFGESGAAVFKGHQMILEDETYTDAITAMIGREGTSAEYAVTKNRERLVEIFAGMSDIYIRAKADDIKDVSDRLLGNLGGTSEIDFRLPEASIICAKDLTPGEFLRMDPEKILGVVTVRGSENSHTAILARMKKIPSVSGVCMDMDSLKNGTPAIVDGGTGEVFLDPDGEKLQEAQKKIKEEAEKQRLLQELKGMDSVTESGRHIRIYANINEVPDVFDALENDAEGVGLFRSECFYLGRKDFPSEEEQFLAYRTVLEQMGEKDVIIRTLDIGADKAADYFQLEKEENSALGFRGIRVCLKRPDIFKTQLRALLRAAGYGNLSILYPMISSVDEVKKIHEIVDETAKELDVAGIAYRIPRQGIMIETPAAVMMSEELAQMVDFFSIGTNDLTQYTLAVDRQNERLGDFCDPRHPAILRMIQMTIDSAHKYGRQAGICGELAADPVLTETLVKMGVDELSVSPPMILPLREKIRSIK